MSDRTELETRLQDAKNVAASRYELLVIAQKERDEARDAVLKLRDALSNKLPRHWPDWIATAQKAMDDTRSYEAFR